MYWDQKNSKYQNTSYVGAQFLHVSWQGVGGRFVSYATDQVHFKHVQPQVLLIESHVAIGTIQQTQDAASVLWVYRHNSRHAAWPTVILRFTRMETGWKTLALSPRKSNETKFRE